MFPEKGYDDGARLSIGPHFAMSNLTSEISIAKSECDVIENRSFRTGLSIQILRKEVIQPQVPLRLPCYDFAPVIDLTLVGCLLAVSLPASGKTNFHGVTGGVYKARERIHRSVLICDY